MRAGLAGCATCRLPVNTTARGCVYDSGGRPHHDCCLRWAFDHPGERVRLTKAEKLRVVR